MRDSYFSCDTREFISLTERLTGKEMKKVQRQALQKGSSILVKQTRKEMKRAGFKFRKGMEKAVSSRINRYKDRATIHLFGQHSLMGKDRGIMRYLEVGTQERYRNVKYSYRKGKRMAKTAGGQRAGYSGKIKGYRFFERAREATENSIERAINAALELGINKINNSKI